MLMTTTALVEGRHITKYHGVVTGEAIIGANAVRDLFAGLRDFFGGRSGSYEEVLRKAKDTALQEMGEEAARLGANAVIGIDLDYETVGASGSMLMVTCSGTAVSMECGGGWYKNPLSLVLVSRKPWVSKTFPLR